MTVVTFFKNDGKYLGFCAEGHAGFKRKGKDIICSAISILTINTVNSLTEINHEEVMVNTDDGCLKAMLLTDNDESSQTLLKSLALGLESIQEEYGSKYCKVVYKEEDANVKA